MWRATFLRDANPIRQGSAGATVAIGVLILLLGLPQLVLGSFPPGVVLNAPYRGVTVSYSIGTSQTGCSSVKVLKPLSFHTITGVGQFNVRTLSPSCTSRVGNVATSDNWFLVYVPIRASSGASTIVANWTISARGAENLSIGTCAGGNASSWWSCEQTAYAYLAGYAYLQDSVTYAIYTGTTSWPGIDYQTSNSSVCAGPFYGCSNTSTGANASFAVHRSISFWVNATMNHHHLYYLVLVMYGGAHAGITASGSSIAGGRASASFDLGSGSHGANLTSVTVR